MKKLKKIVRLSLSLAIGLSLFSCNNQTNDFISETPFAQEELLESFTANGYVNYKVSRFFAFETMQEFSNTYSWENATLSKKPVVIYNSITGEPRFYEFRVIKGNEEVGAISCVANKKEGKPVRYVLPYASEIKKSTSRSIICGQNKIVDASYPTKLITKDFSTSRALDTNTGTEYSQPVETEVTVKELILSADDDLLATLGLDDKEKYEEALRLLEEQEKKDSEYWAFIDSVEKNILEVTDEELLSIARNANTWADDYQVVLKEWYDKIDWTGNFGEYCGPNCMAFITLGFGKDSGYKDCPTSNNDDDLKALYNKFGETIGTGPKVYSELSNGLAALTNYKLEPDFLHFFDTIKNNIDSTGYPSVSLRSSKLFQEWSKLQWHYRVIIGYRYSYPIKYHQFLWWNWTTNETERYYIMHDNGSDSGLNGEFLEIENTYYLLWSAHVIKK